MYLPRPVGWKTVVHENLYIRSRWKHHGKGSNLDWTANYSDVLGSGIAARSLVFTRLFQKRVCKLGGWSC